MRIKSKVSALSLAVTASVLATFQAPSIFAQEQERAIEEIVVTSTRREQNLQDVPITVSAIPAAELARQGVQTIEDIYKVAPEARVDEAGAFSIISVRGIRPNSFGPMAEGATAFHVDGVYSPRLLGLNGYYYDMERVEVLSGPQGTLYGRNAQAGTINVITRKPEMGVFGGEVGAEVGDYGLFRLNGAVNIPVSDNVALRLASRYYETGGYMDTDLGDRDEQGFRASLRYEPSALLSMDFVVDIQREGGKGANTTTWIECSANIASFCPNDPYSNAFLVGDAAFYDRDNENRGFAALVDYESPFGILTYQGSIRWSDTFEESGASYNGWRNPAAPPSHNGEVDEYRWIQQEIRLASPGGETLEWQVGASWYDDKLLGPNAPGYDVPEAGQYQTCILVSDCPTGYSPGDDIAGIGWAMNDVRSKSIFGQATWTPVNLQQLHLTLGLRYNDDEKWSIGTYIGRANTPPYDVVLSIAYPDQDNPAPQNMTPAYRNWKQTTYTATLAYDIAEDHMVYFTNSTGYKAGTFAYGVTPEAPPGESMLLEIGSRSVFLDGRLQLNLSLWNMDFDDYETTVQAYNEAIDRNFLETEAADKASADGFQADLNWFITDNDRVSINAVHTDNTYDSFDLTDRLPPESLNAADFSGTPMGQSVDWTYNASYNHIFLLGNGGSLDAGLSYNHQDDRILGSQVTTADFLAGNYNYGGGFDTLDFTLQYTPNSDNWDVTFFVRNLTDKLYLSGTTQTTVDTACDPQLDGTYTDTCTYTTGSYGAPRSMGMQANYRF